MKEKELIFEKCGEKNLLYFRRERILIMYIDKLVLIYDVVCVVSLCMKSFC